LKLTLPRLELLVQLSNGTARKRVSYVYLIRACQVVQLRDPDDDDIETSIQIRIRDLSWMDMWSGGSDMSPRPRVGSPHPEDSQAATHGITATNEPACCRRESTGVVDCQACLDQEYGAFVSSIDQREREAMSILIKALNDAGSSGIPKDQLLVCTYTKMATCMLNTG
jgi:hypothetical protein